MKKDLEPLMLSKEKFEYVLNNYPDTDFAQDAKFKLNLIQDILASKEMYIGKYYLKRKNGLPQLIDLKIYCQTMKQLFMSKKLFTD